MVGVTGLSPTFCFSFFFKSFPLNLFVSSRFTDLILRGRVVSCCASVGDSVLLSFPNSERAQLFLLLAIMFLKPSLVMLPTVELRSLA